MDIDVSRLNKRMALELPPEFPLGLVFVVGEVTKLATVDDGAKGGDFYLSEGDYHLLCRLSQRTAAEVTLDEGDLIRAGGHLAFEPTRAGYYLLARDVEILSEIRPSNSPLKKIIADKKERVQPTNLTPAEIPPWVELLAPPVIRAEIEGRRAALAASHAAVGDGWEFFDDAKAGMAHPAEEPALSGLSDDLIDFLSEAMDGQDEVELTPQLLAEYEPPQKLAKPSIEDLEALRELENALLLTILKEESLANDESMESEDSAVARGSELPEVGEAAGEAAEISKLYDNSTGTSLAAENEDIAQEQPAPVTEKMADPERSQPEKLASVPGDSLVYKQSRETYIPWYLVVVVILLAIFIVVAFMVVALNSTSMPVPFSLP